jgi:hypothetical protein
LYVTGARSASSARAAASASERQMSSKPTSIKKAIRFAPSELSIRESGS